MKLGKANVDSITTVLEEDIDIAVSDKGVSIGDVFIHGEPKEVARKLRAIAIWLEEIAGKVTLDAR